MTTIYTPEQTAIILRSINDFLMGNNGWSFVGSAPWLLDALRAAGFAVWRSTDYFGLPCYKASTQAAQAAFRVEHAAGRDVELTYKPATPRIDGPDYEAAILDRQERLTMDY